MPNIETWQERTPVLIDDMVSTAQTMIAAVTQLRNASTHPPVCVGVHALFCDDAYAALIGAGVEAVVTCNTIVHPSNAIDIFSDITQAVRSMISGLTATISG